MTSASLYEVLAARSGKPAPNQDPDNGVRYGVIPSNHCSQDAIDDIYSDGTDETYAACVAEVKSDIARIWQNWERERDNLEVSSQDSLDLMGELIRSWYHGELYRTPPDDLDDWLDHYVKLSEETFVESLWEDVSDDWNDRYESVESSYSYEYDGYVLTLGSDGDIFVIKSPYYTLRGLCSPCAPNACYLETDGNLKCYCLGPEWFDAEYEPMSYPCFKLTDGSEVSAR